MECLAPSSRLFGSAGCRRGVAVFSGLGRLPGGFLACALGVGPWGPSCLPCPPAPRRQVCEVDDDAMLMYLEVSTLHPLDYWAMQGFQRNRSAL